MGQVIILSKDVFATQMLQAAGMFEDFKVIAMPPVIVDFEGDFGQRQIDALLMKKDNDPYQVIAIVEGKTIIYKDETVKVVSNGSKWGMFDDFIKQLQEGPK